MTGEPSPKLIARRKAREAAQAARAHLPQCPPIDPKRERPTRAERAAESEAELERALEYLGVSGK